MTVSNTPPTLQSILSRIEGGTPAAAPRAEAPVPRDGAPIEQRRNAATEPRVNVPKDAPSLDPNAPRGTYLNLTV